MKNGTLLLVLALQLTPGFSAGVQGSAQADAEVGMFSFDGIDFRYVREGKGPPVVVIGSSRAEVTSLFGQYGSRDERNSLRGMPRQH